MFKTLFAGAALAFAIPAMAQTNNTWHIDPAHSSVNFSVKHMGVSTVRGSLTGVKGDVVWDNNNPAQSRVEATIDANTVDTANSQRDTHLKSADFFNVQQYPTLKFVSTGVKRNGEGKLQITGNLTLDGQTHPVTLDVDGPAAPQKGMKGGLVSGFSATGNLSRKEFNFGQKFPEPMLSDQVSFTIDVEIDQQ